MVRSVSMEPDINQSTAVSPFDLGSANYRIGGQLSGEKATAVTLIWFFINITIISTQINSVNEAMLTCARMKRWTPHSKELYHPNNLSTRFAHSPHQIKL